MIKDIQKCFIKRFFSIFILMLLILIILPFLVERAVMLFSEGIQPGRNSIIVFKPIMVEYGSVHEFIENIIKIINFM
ncbi:MAG: hypothetical protein ACM3ZR_13215 [Pseudomonadota bacterium]